VGSITIKVESNLLARIAQALNTKKARIVRETREDIAADARKRVHVLTGALRDSIVATEQGVEAGTQHALAEEFGMPPNRAPHPYLTPAVEAARPKMLERLAGEELFGIDNL
jgi:hypothetical protein